MQKYFDGGIRAIDYANMASAYLIRIENEKITGDHRRVDLEKAIFYYDKALPYLNAQSQVSVYIAQAFAYRDLKMKVHALDALAHALEIEPQNPVAQKEYQSITARNL